MTEYANIPEAGSISFLVHRQLLHLVALALLVAICWAFAAPVLGHGEWLGLTDTVWYWASVTIAAVHQVIVALIFRAQLGWSILTRMFGKADMVVWGIVFMPLLLARPLAIAGLAVANAGTMSLPSWFAIPAGIGLLIPAVYTGYCVGRYFGIDRAIGGDHFRQRYREMPLVREGAFAWSSNAMYAFVFLGLWGIALIAGSTAALAGALFQHAYIWVHYYCTEEPDMKLIYGSSG
jgi:protein-S-isoprenylcysteine O-methyltransferase Ste14